MAKHLQCNFTLCEHSSFSQFTHFSSRHRTSSLSLSIDHFSPKKNERSKSAYNLNVFLFFLNKSVQSGAILIYCRKGVVNKTTVL